MFCPKCGNELREEMKFCPKCGRKVDWLKENETSTAENSKIEDESIAVVENTAETVEAATENVEAPVAEENVTAEETVAEEIVVEKTVVEKTVVEETAAEETAAEETVVEETVVEETAAETKNEEIAVVEKAEQRSESADTSKVEAESADDDKINWKDYFTKENIERFAPAAALVPLAMAVASFVLGKVLFLALGWFSVGYTISKVVLFILKALFVVTSAAATAGLAYVAAKFKDKNLVTTWITPFATGLAFISCLGIAFGWKLVAWITGIIAVLFGLEFLGRIVIGRRTMDSAMDPKFAFETCKKSYKEYREKYPTSNELEKTEVENVEASKFDGTGLGLLGYSILLVLVSLITCGIATPWMICKLYRWEMEHTTINGKRLTFTGSGGSLLGHWILWEILTAITCGIYGFFVHVALRKWEMKHTFIAGEPIVANGNESYFDGGTLAYIGYSILGSLLMIVTCLIGTPWAVSMLEKWDTKHQVINNRRLVYSGSGLGLLGEFLICLVFSIITCGIFYPWAEVRIKKYIIKHTDFVR